ncbi:unnamed protein product [Caenorhabditis auriculariae]|uniref:Uncharacterized protein n=1 Tax=Caenorhabditis auriculariae TaxID=2777116 RepID=A0A8S1HLW0_9PELO|nr:unnamed protein product [Caenorhabditis auriculariae]
MIAPDLNRVGKEHRRTLAKNLEERAKATSAAHVVRLANAYKSLFAASRPLVLFILNVYSSLKLRPLRVDQTNQRSGLPLSVFPDGDAAGN